MTRLQDGTDLDTMLELVAERGPEAMASVFTTLLNLAMKIERQKVLGVAPFERSPDRNGQAMGADCDDWQPLGGGPNNEVHAIVEWDGNLVVGGSFTQVADLSVNRIALWNGAGWEPLDTGVNSTVYAMAVYEGDLIAAGQFSQAGGNPALRVARWDGVEWAPVGGGVVGPGLE